MLNNDKSSAAKLLGLEQVAAKNWCGWVWTIK
jgi:hypothetical protein